LLIFRLIRVPAAVPKFVQMTMKPPSGANLPPGGTLTQVLSVTNTMLGRQRRQDCVATVSSDAGPTALPSPSHDDAGATASPARRWADNVAISMLGRTHRQLDAGPTASPTRRADSIPSTEPGRQLRQHDARPALSVEQHR